MKSELIARVWPNTIVEEGTLRVHINALRKALGERGGENRYKRRDQRRVPGHQTGQSLGAGVQGGGDGVDLLILVQLEAVLDGPQEDVGGSQAHDRGNGPPEEIVPVSGKSLLSTLRRA